MPALLAEVDRLTRTVATQDRMIRDHQETDSQLRRAITATERECEEAERERDAATRRETRIRSMLGIAPDADEAAVAAECQRYRALDVALAEALATLANERGEGEPPSEGHAVQSKG